MAARPPSCPPPLATLSPRAGSSPFTVRSPNAKRQRSRVPVKEEELSIDTAVAARSASAGAGAGTPHATLMSAPLSIVIFGATGDLARKKLFPALHALVAQGKLPRHLRIVGYGRNPVELDAFVAKQCVNVPEDGTGRSHSGAPGPAAQAPLRRADFCARIEYHAGAYDCRASYERLDAELRAHEAAHASGLPGNRIFFLSVPPSVFGTVTEMISRAARSAEGGFTRLMIEKPFGRDSASFDELNQLTAAHFDESQLFRLDHYLGKEVILNISTLRWGNAVFEPLWSAAHIESVQITFKENIGTAGRGNYFDESGIVRDIVQNHLLQARAAAAGANPRPRTVPT